MRSTLVRHVLLVIISWMWLEFRLKISSSGSSSSSSRQAKKPSNPTCLIYRNFSLRETSHLFFIISEMEIKICTCGTEQHKFDMEGRNFSFKNIQLTCLNLRSIFLSPLLFSCCLATPQHYFLAAWASSSSLSSDEFFFREE